MRFYSQRDNRYGQVKLGSSNLNINDYGCFLVSLINLAGATISPDIIAKQKKFFSGAMLFSGAIAKELGMKATGRTTTPPKTGWCIGRKKVPSIQGMQHFTCINPSLGLEIDPYDKDVKVKPISGEFNQYRLFEGVKINHIGVKSEISSWAKDAVKWGIENKIMTKWDNPQEIFSKKGYSWLFQNLGYTKSGGTELTKEQVMVIIKRMIDDLSSKQSCPLDTIKDNMNNDSLPKEVRLKVVDFEPQGTSACKVASAIIMWQSTLLNAGLETQDIDPEEIKPLMSDYTSTYSLKDVFQEYNRISSAKVGFRLDKQTPEQQKETLNKIRKLLADKSPLICALKSRKWENTKNGNIYELEFKDSKHGSHYVCITGYDEKYFYGENPWGKEYSFRIKAEDMLKFCGGFLKYFID